MPERTSGTPCPPHRWLVRTRQRDGVLVEHHRCLRCGAEKDIPWTVATRDKRWRRAAGDAAHPGHRAVQG